MKAESNSFLSEAWTRFGDHLDLSAIHQEALKIVKIVHRLDGGDRIRSRHAGILAMLREANARLFVYEVSQCKRGETAPPHDPMGYVGEIRPAKDASSTAGFVDHSSAYLLDTEYTSTPLDSPSPYGLERDVGIASSGSESSASLFDTPLPSNEDARSIAINPDLQGRSGSRETSHLGDDGFATEFVKSEQASEDAAESSPPPEPWRPDRQTYKTLIELLDLLDKARTDERMGPERMVRNLVRKKEPLAAAFGIDRVAPLLTDPVEHALLQEEARTLLEWIAHAEESPYEKYLDEYQRLLKGISTTLGMERIDRRGLFDVADQHILEMIDTDDPVLDQTIEGTVECGYRIGDWVLRPQKVFVYQLASKEQKSTSHEQGKLK